MIGNRQTGDREAGERMMESMTTKAPITAHELMQMTIPDKEVELVRGVLLVREPAGGLHGSLSNDLAYRLTGFVKRHDLGTVFGQDTGFQIEADPDTVRAPDVAFVSKARLPGAPPEEYPALAPDLAVEIISPNDRPGAVLAKAGAWLEAGTRLVWVLDPRARQVHVHRAGGSLALLGPGDVLDGEDVLPGWSCRISELMASVTSDQ